MITRAPWLSQHSPVRPPTLQYDWPVHVADCCCSATGVSKNSSWCFIPAIGKARYNHIMHLPFYASFQGTWQSAEKVSASLGREELQLEWGRWRCNMREAWGRREGVWVRVKVRVREGGRELEWKQYLSERVEAENFSEGREFERELYSLVLYSLLY